MLGDGHASSSGETLDLHAGGVDLIFPHHEDEIAQSEAARAESLRRACGATASSCSPTARRCRSASGNVATAADCARGDSAAAVRHFVFNTHYRKQLDLTDEALEAASSASAPRWASSRTRLARASGGTPAMARAADELEQEVCAALFDDLNAPEAQRALFEFVTA